MNELKSKVERAGQFQQFKCNFSPIIGIQWTKTFSVNRFDTMLNVCEGLVLALGRFFSYEAGVFFMLT